MQERLQKYLSRVGIASRRKGEELILQGQIRVNNQLVTRLGTKIDPQKDVVEVKGKKVKFIRQQKYTYILLNKPKGYLTSLYDPYQRPTILDLLPGVKERVYPVGRLDYNSEGLLLLTNDGEITYTLTHPSHKVEKTYIVKVKGIPSDEKLKLLSQGVVLKNNYQILPCKIYRLQTTKENTVLKIKIREGKKRQIRKMGEYLGHPVIELRRIQMGPLQLKGLKPGEYRYLKQKEIESLKEIYEKK